MPTSFHRSASSRRSAHTAFTFLASLALLALTGCETDQRTPRPGSPPPPSAANAPTPTPELEARAKFFDGQLETEVLLSRSGFSPRPGRAAGPGGENRGRSGFSGGFGGAAGGKRGGGGSGVERSGGGPRGDSPASRGSPARDDDPRPRIVAENQPPVQFHLRLTNHGPAALEVEVLDFNSALGNFVVQPRKLTVAPDASVEAEPMTSRLGLTSTEFPLTLRLRSASRTEQQILILHPIASPASPPTPAHSP